MHRLPGRSLSVLSPASLFAFMLALGLAACGSDGEAEDAGSGAGGDVSLVEWAIDAPTTYEAGEVSFVATNDSTTFPHELAIARGDSFDTLPRAARAVDEDALATDFLGRTERIGPGQTATLTLELEPGNYVLYCNLGPRPGSHAANGQVLSITVEG